METKKTININQLKSVEKEMKRFLMTYKFGLEEVKTKINILNEEFKYIHDYNPIEHVKSRIKSPESILKKLSKKNIEVSLDSIKKNIKDIAGVRIVCSFISDIYIISEMLQKQKDLKVIRYQDYIKNPKSNGYQSLHMILQVPVFMSDRVEDICVEVQIRTMAMDFWASLEHKIYYKYDADIPKRLKDELNETAVIVSQLDRKMEGLNREILNIKNSNSSEEVLIDLAIKENFLQLVDGFLNIEE